MKKIINNKWILSSLVLLILLSSFSTFKLLDDDDDFEISKNLEIYYTLIRELSIFYVDKPDPGKLITENINTMLKGLDPYTVYIPETRIEDYKTMSTGEYGGVGASIILRESKVIISSIYAHSPAKDVGLLVGDEIISISGKKMEKLNMLQIGALMKGSANTNLTMKVKRVGKNELLDFNLSRKDIKIKNVPYYSMLNDKTGYIKLSGFTYDAAEEVSEAFTHLKDQGMSNLVFDLRGNPGGLLIESVRIVNLFIKKNQLIVKTLGRVEQWNHSFKTSSEPLDTLINVVVLVSSMSASASEIVSGALQDLDRAVIVGEKSFGKGLVQATRPLIYNSQLKLTTAKYYIPSGRCIQALDYSNRNPDGSVGKVPDSLITEFKTNNGRSVFDGGGVSPDVKVDNRKTSQLISQLKEEFVIFDFISLYVSENTLEYKDISDINKAGKLFNEFTQYAKNAGFKYKTKREEQLSKLIEIAKDEKTFEEIEPELSVLKEKLAHNLEKDLLNFKEEITFLLETELASRFFYLKGKIQKQLTDDKQLIKAIEVVSDSKRMETLLNLTVR